MVSITLGDLSSGHMVAIQIGGLTRVIFDVNAFTISSYKTHLICTKPYLMFITRMLDCYCHVLDMQSCQVTLLIDSSITWNIYWRLWDNLSLSVRTYVIERCSEVNPGWKRRLLLFHTNVTLLKNTLEIEWHISINKNKIDKITIFSLVYDKL